MAETDPGQDPVGEDARVAALQKRLTQAEAVEKARTGKTGVPAADESYRLGNRVLAELVGAPVGGALIGWVLDRLFGTSPWVLLFMLFMGFVVGFRNIIRISTKRPDR